MQWTLYLRITGMPADLIKVGDTFGLTVDALIERAQWGTSRQTVALTKGSDVVVFAATDHQILGYLIPNLAPFQIDVSDGGAVCQDPSRGFGDCPYRSHAAVVTAGGETATVLDGHTARIGWLSFTNGGFGDGNPDAVCDGGVFLRMGGFRTP